MLYWNGGGCCAKWSLRSEHVWSCMDCGTADAASGRGPNCLEIETEMRGAGVLHPFSYRLGWVVTINLPSLQLLGSLGVLKQNYSKCLLILSKLTLQKFVSSSLPFANTRATNNFHTNIIFPAFFFLLFCLTATFNRDLKIMSCSGVSYSESRIGRSNTIDLWPMINKMQGLPPEILQNGTHPSLVKPQDYEKSYFKNEQETSSKIFKKALNFNPNGKRDLGHSAFQ